MAYEKKFVNPYPDGWIDLPEEETPVDAEAMQKITDGIEGIDNYLSENPPDELKESLTQYEQSGYLSRNLNNQPLEKGYINYQTGVNVSNDRYVRSVGAVKVEPNTDYTISVESSVSQIVIIHYYNGTYKGYSATNSGTFNEFTFKSNADANEIRYYFDSTNLNNKVQIEKGTESHPYQNYAPSNIELKQSLSQLSEVTSGNATVVSDKITNPSLRWFKVGNVAHIFGLFSLASTWNGAQENMFNDLPMPQEDMFVFINKYNDGSTRRVKLIKNGNSGSLVQLYSNMTTDQYFINFTYICK